MKLLKTIFRSAALSVIFCSVCVGAYGRPAVKTSIKKGKILLELPDSLLGRTWAMASTVRATSDSRMGAIGLKDVSGLHFYTFEKVDSTIRMKEVSFDFSSSDGNILKALSDCHAGATVEKFKIKSQGSDGGYVVDATAYFLSDKKELDPTENNPTAREKVKKSFKKDLSYITGTKCFDDNFSVAVSRSYTYEVKKKDIPLTVETVTSFLLLPEEIYHPRQADPRINFFFTRRNMVEDLNSTSKDVWFVNRWRLEPSDTAAYRKGVAVEPVKPITFWIDNNFPEWWKPYIFDAVLQWNDVFESIGFKNAVRALPFPEDDPEFDPENIRYNCIRYAPVAVQNAMGPSWTDPRSGEIINASVWVYHDVIKLLSVWMFVQTAQADPSVRCADIPREILGDALTYVLRHEVGHTLGLMHNMSASTCYTMEQLRDPQFTRENGTTPSIMDYARFNYVAKPGDKERGVRLTPPRFGKNDYWAIRWGYTPVFDAASFEEEARITAQWITDSVAVSPLYRYGKQQMGLFFDPRCQTEDLSDDVFAASAAGIENLKYIMSRFIGWIDDADDPDMKYRTELYRGIVNQYLRYAGHLMHNIEGLYRTETVPGDGFKRFENVPRDIQIKALDTVFAMYADLDWLEDKAVLGRLPVVGTPVDAVRRSIAENIMGKVFAAAMIDGIDTEELPVRDVSDLLFDKVWGPSSKLRELTDGERLFQRVYVESLMNMAGFRNPAAAKDKPAAFDDRCCDIVDPRSSMGEITYDDISGFEWEPRNFGGGHVTQPTVYAELMRVRKLIGKKSGRGEDKGHYALLRSIIDYGVR